MFQLNHLSRPLHILQWQRSALVSRRIRFPADVATREHPARFTFLNRHLPAPEAGLLADGSLQLHPPSRVTGRYGRYHSGNGRLFTVYSRGGGYVFEPPVWVGSSRIPFSSHSPVFNTGQSGTSDCMIACHWASVSSSHYALSGPLCDITSETMAIRFCSVGTVICPSGCCGRLITVTFMPSARAASNFAIPEMPPAFLVTR